MKFTKITGRLGKWSRHMVWEKVFVVVAGLMVVGAAAGTPVSAAEVLARFEGVGSAMAATSSDPVCSNDGVPAEIKAASGCGGNLPELPDVITSIVNGVIAMLGFLAVIMIVVGGYKYMTAAGDTSKLEAAKKTLLYACVGLIICALAFMIVNLVIISIIGGQQPPTQ